MGSPTIQRTFAGGELAPALHARADQVKYVTGLRTCRNFMVLRSGGAANRSGFRFVGECKTSSPSVQLHRYVSAVAGESILIEAGNYYLRFWKNGGLVTLTGVTAYNGATAYAIGDICASAGVNYYCIAPTTGNAPPNATYWYPMPGSVLEIPTPFGSSGWNAVQNGDVITMTSGAGVVQPHELIYVSLTHWVIQPVTTAPSVAAPVGVTATPGAAGTLTRAYQVTAAAPDTYEEGLASGTASCPLTAAPTETAPIVVAWTAISGVPEYYVYCDPYGNGTFGFLGVATGGTTFNDVGQVPDFTLTPPMARVLFNSSGNYPRRAAYHQQRRLFANTDVNPDGVFGSRVGFPSNFNVSSPLQDDDAITFRISGNQQNPVRHMVGLKQLIILTDAGEWRVSGGAEFAPLTPSSIFPDQETYVGIAPDPAPVVIGNAILYVQARGAIVRDLRFEQEVEGLAGRDLTIFATHLFDGFTVEDMDYQQTPHSIVWCCRSDGTLLGLTYLREHEVAGWHRHDTGAGGLFEHVCVVPEVNEDTLYVIVRRTINGAYHRYIERLERREIFNFAADAFFVDSGLSYDGPPALTFANLDHLEGQYVAVLADGVVLFNGLDLTAPGAAAFRVNGGQVTLPAPAAPATGYSVVHIGLPIAYAELETLDLDVAGSDIRDKKKKIASVSMIVDASSRVFYLGPDAAHLFQYRPTPYEGNAAAFTGQVESTLTTQYDERGRLFIRQTEPLPLTILGIIPNVELGG